MKPHSISVVVPTWNGVEDIHASLGSLVALTNSNPNVDNGSTNIPKSRRKGQSPRKAHVVKHIINNDCGNHLSVKIST